MTHLRPMQQDAGPTRMPTSDDKHLLEDAKVPATLNLIEIVYPVLSPLEKIIRIAAKYEWDSSQVVVTTDYDGVAADLVTIQSMLVVHSDIEAGISLASENLQSNYNTVFNYHFQRIRNREDSQYHEKLILYKNKQIPKPERTTDSAIKAEVEVIMAMLNFPQEINKLRALNKQVSTLMKKSEGLVIVLQVLMRRAENRGQ